ncbi:MAG: hypothetical protein GX279_06185 [Clostridiaceae bacterium]|nr:hypothetical protein [Clostridiaceae bacterium]
MTSLTQKIKGVRKMAGLTQQDLSKLYGIPKRTIEEWDRGAYEPPEYVANLLIDRIKADFLYDHSEKKKDLSAPKKLIFLNNFGKPLKEPVLSGVKRAYDDGKVQNLGSDTFDEEDNCRQDPKGKLYLVLEPENYGLDMGITFYVKEV